MRFLTISIGIFLISTVLQAVDKPNFILINVDDLGWTDLGCFGSKIYETPNIDDLAENGVRFTDAYAACAVCSPTRAAIMTGRYPARLGVTDWIRARFQGGRIPNDKKNPMGWIGSKSNKVLCPKNALWMVYVPNLPYSENIYNHVNAGVMLLHFIHHRIWQF